MPRLKDRERQIPNGLTFYEPSLKWRPAPYSSFDTITRQLIQARRANPYLVKQNGWALEYGAVAEEVDRYNAAVCRAHGWNQFIMEDVGVGGAVGGGPPKTLARSNLNAGRVAAGINIVLEMFGKEGPVRDRALAEKRAAVCVECPMNDKGDWTSWFTVPAQAMIRKALGIVKDLDLTTSQDSNLNICKACGCPLKGKVYARLNHILAHLPAEDAANLPPQCWIRTEQQTSALPIATRD